MTEHLSDEDRRRIVNLTEQLSEYDARRDALYALLEELEEERVATWKAIERLVVPLRVGDIIAFEGDWFGWKELSGVVESVWLARVADVYDAGDAALVPNGLKAEEYPTFLWGASGGVYNKTGDVGARGFTARPWHTFDLVRREGQKLSPPKHFEGQYSPEAVASLRAVLSDGYPFGENPFYETGKHLRNPSVSASSGGQTAEAYPDEVF